MSWTVKFTNFLFHFFPPPLVVGKDGWSELELGVSLLQCGRLELPGQLGPGNTSAG